MEILLTGSTGFLGSHLKDALEKKGYRISTLRGKEIKTVKASKLEGFDAVIHLAGENIAAKRWNEDVKKEIYNSRVHTTHDLVGKFLAVKNKPKVFISASAVGIYKDHQENWVDEEGEEGDHFLANVCKEWEIATYGLQDTRHVQLRFGVILSKEGGALPKMLAPFKWGLGGIVGSGDQFMSWISLEDAIRAILFLLEKDIRGPVNIVSPNPIKEKEFVKESGKALHRPTFLKIPVWLTRLIFGEVADNLFLLSIRAKPKKLQEAGFEFKKPYLRDVLNSFKALEK